jgi:RNA polymerase sigma-70 factor (ECF subfamily)
VDGDELEDGSWLRDTGPSLEARFDDTELADALQTCLQMLPFAARTVLALVDVDGLSYEEAAAALGIPVGTVKSRLARARASMRQALMGFTELLPVEYQAFQTMYLQV